MGRSFSGWATNLLKRALLPSPFSKGICGIGFGTAVAMGGETGDLEHPSHRSSMVEKEETAILL
jgi:hypothetical protein